MTSDEYGEDHLTMRRWFKSHTNYAAIWLLFPMRWGWLQILSQKKFCFIEMSTLKKIFFLLKNFFDEKKLFFSEEKWLIGNLYSKTKQKSENQIA